MLLSDKSVDALAACVAFSATMGPAARRKMAEEAVRAAAKEIGVDPLSPPLPDFAAGEDGLAAVVVRTLEVAAIERELEQHRARLAAARGAARRVADLEQRCAELEQIERDRVDARVAAGKEYEDAPADAIKEHAAIVDRLRLVGSSTRFAGLMQRESEGSIITAAAMQPDTIPTVVFVCDLISEKLRIDAEDAPQRRRHAAEETARGWAHRVAVIVNHVSNGQDPDLYVTVRRVHRAVELADLHRLHAEQEAALEQLERDKKLELVKAGR